MRLTNAKNFFCALVVVMAVSACKTPAGPKNQGIEDFALAELDNEPPVVNDDVNPEQEKQMQKLLVKPSLPLAIRIGKGVDRFKNIPQNAFPPSPALFVIKKDGCRLYLGTSTIQIDQYLGVANNEQISMAESLPSGTVIKLEPEMNFYFKVSSLIQIGIAKSDYHICKKQFYGKLHHLGAFSINKTWTAMIPAPGTTPARLFILKNRSKGTKVLLKWDIKSAYPVLVDEFETEVHLESQLFRAKLAKNGFYYLNVRPKITSNNLKEGFVQFVH